SVPGYHLPAAAVELAHERDVGEAVALDRRCEGLDGLGIHGVGDVRGMALDRVHLDLRNRETLARARCLVEEPGDREAGCDVARRAHGAPPRQARRSPWQDGCPARRM